MMSYPLQFVNSGWSDLLLSMVSQWLESMLFLMQIPAIVLSAIAQLKYFSYSQLH